MSAYVDAHRESLENPEAFWLRAARNVTWARPPSCALDDSRRPFYSWFPDGELNTCANALDRHVEEGRGDALALIYDSPVTGTMATYTYSEMLEKVAAFAGLLKSLGVLAGDRVVIYMPMVPEAVIAMLACARLGAVHSVVFGGFAAAELSLRLDDAKPKVVVTASCGIEGERVIAYKPILDQAIQLADQPPLASIVLQRPQARAKMGPKDVDWADGVAKASPAGCVNVSATDPLYILYTSGTTGKPKGVVRDNGGHAVALLWSMRHVFGVRQGDVFWAASDVGWVVGHSYIVYGPLLAGCTTVLYEGKPVGTPDAGAFWRVIAQHGVNVLFTAPTAFRAIRRADAHGDLLRQHDTSPLERLFLAGERLDSETYKWAKELLGVPIIDNWWQMETGWPIASALIGLGRPPKPGSAGVPVPGFRVKVLAKGAEEAEVGTDGPILIALPLPPGALSTLWQDDARYIASYLSYREGYYLTGDSGHFDVDGYLHVMGRVDDVINVAGHRLSTGTLEGVLASHPLVAESAVIGVQDPLKGQVPRGFVVLKDDVGESSAARDIAAELLDMIRDRVGAFASLKRVDVVQALPKTRSGKILRRWMREVADGSTYSTPSTIEDKSVLDLLRPVLTQSE